MAQSFIEPGHPHASWGTALLVVVLMAVLAGLTIAVYFSSAAR